MRIMPVLLHAANMSAIKIEIYLILTPYVLRPVMYILRAFASPKMIGGVIRSVKCGAKQEEDWHYWKAKSYL